MRQHILIARAAAFLLSAAVSFPITAQGVVPTQDFDVFVDLPTGFAFIKTPKGWRFIRKLDPAQLKELPPTTLTSLLEEPTHMGSSGISHARPAPRTNGDLVNGGG